MGSIHFDLGGNISTEGRILPGIKFEGAEYSRHWQYHELKS